MAKSYANENFPIAVVEELRGLGHDVITIHETGKAEQRIPDDVVFQHAVADDRAVLTLNARRSYFGTKVANGCCHSAISSDSPASPDGLSSWISESRVTSPSSTQTPSAVLPPSSSPS